MEADQNAKGKDSKSNRNDNDPINNTGSFDKLETKLFIYLMTILNHLLILFNKKYPPNKEINIGDHDARIGFNAPLTPKELKVKLRT